MFIDCGVSLLARALFIKKAQAIKGAICMIKEVIGVGLWGLRFSWGVLVSVKEGGRNRGDHSGHESSGVDPVKVIFIFEVLNSVKPVVHFIFALFN